MHPLSICINGWDVPSRLRRWGSSRLRFLTLPLLLLAACSSPADDLVLPQAPIPLEEFPIRLAQETCKIRAACQPPSWFVESACVQAELIEFTSIAVRRHLSLVAHGHVTYDPQAAADCLAQLDCDSAPIASRWLQARSPRRQGEPAELPSCQRIFQGKSGLGETCDDDVECGVGYCQGCPTTCQLAYAADGQTCSDDTDCLGSSACLDTCQQTRHRGQGDACAPTLFNGTNNQYGRPGNQEFDCDDGLSWCKSNGSGDFIGTCAAKLPVQSPCMDSAQCANGLYCAGASGTATCVVAPLGPILCQDVGNGPSSHCPDGQQCIDNWCADATVDTKACHGRLCRQDEHCVADVCVPYPDLGESCTFRCLNGFCDSALSRCVAGRSCAVGCPPRHCLANGKCDWALPWDPCSTDADCSQSDVSLYCISGVCRATGTAESCKGTP